MKKKFVLACLLAGALSMNSVAYASASGQSLGEVTKEAVGNPEAVEAETEAATGVAMESVEETSAEAAVEETAENAPEVSAENTPEVPAENALEETYTDGEAADLTKEELIEKMKEAAAELSSVKSEVIMDMDINIIASGDEASTGMQMDMTMNINMANEEIFEPYASHQTTTMVMSILGQTEKEVSEVYIREEDGEHAKYEGSTDENGEITDWERSIDSSAEPEFIFTSESLNELESAIKFTIRDHKAVDTEGKEYYVLESSISLNDAMEQAGMQEELQELLDELKDSLGDMEIPETFQVELYVRADDFLPAEFTIDMSGLKGNMGDSAGEGTNTEMEFKTMVVRYRCSQYNAISEIAYPENLPAADDNGEPELILETESEPEENSGIAGAGEEASEIVENAASALAEELGVKGIQETTDTSVTFTDKGSKENPAAMNEMGKVYIYNAISDQYEQAGLTVTGITGGEEAAAYVDELLNAEGSYYSFSALKNYEEYRIVDYDLYLPTDFSDEEYGIYAPSTIMNVVSEGNDWLIYNGDSYFASTYNLYEDMNSYHPGDTVHCQCVMIVPKDLTEYQLEFGPYGLDYLYVEIQ